MKQCLGCENTIPVSITIDNKVYRNLKNRKYCFECSPFKAAKTGAGRLYSKWTEERKARHRAVCSIRGYNKKAQLVQIAGGKCLICGYNKCQRALQFHHREPDLKMFEVNASTVTRCKWEDVLKEIEKCDLLCVRCHVEVENKAYEHYQALALTPGQKRSYQIKSKVEKPKKKQVKRTAQCPQCFGKMSVQSELCRKCKGISERRITRPSLETLKSKIKELGYCGTGRFYGVSDNAIRKWIKFYETNALVQTLPSKQHPS